MPESESVRLASDLVLEVEEVVVVLGRLWVNGPDRAAVVLDLGVRDMI